MKRMTALAALAACLTLVSAQGGETFAIDPVHSSIGFRIGHMGIAKVTGIFKEFKGDWTVNAETLALEGLNGTVTVKSVDTNSTGRDKHLLNDDFLDEPNHPTMEFKFVKMKDKTTMVGTATIRGVTKEVEWTVSMSKIIDNPRDKGKTRKQGISIRGTLNRKDFGVGNKYPDAAISDKLEVEIELEGSAPGKE